MSVGELAGPDHADLVGTSRSPPSMREVRVRRSAFTSRAAEEALGKPDCDTLGHMS